MGSINFIIYATLASSLLVGCIVSASATTYNFTALGGIPEDLSEATAWKNGALFNKTLAMLKENDILVFPNVTFKMMGGIVAHDLNGVTISFDGTIIFSKDIKSWPRTGNGEKASVLECMHFYNCNNMVFTSSGKGLIDGQGAECWGIPGVGYLVHGENRPRLFNMENGEHNLVENIILKNSPYWTFWAHGVKYLEIRNVDISARRTDYDGHDAIDLSAFNTDGFDVSGDYVWIHDCTVWNQDDCVCAKDGSTNMLFERINASGVGLTIGSIGGSLNKNITFRDIYMHNTFKGIYHLVLCWNSYTIYLVISQRVLVLACNLELLSLQNPNISGTILKKRNSRRSSKPFPSRVKTPAAYVRVRCYTPARFSNFVKDFLAGAYHWTRKESKHVFGFCWRRGETMGRL